MQCLKEMFVFCVDDVFDVGIDRFRLENLAVVTKTY